jgi:pyruvate ferredoxin oxidoreductase gamma subunit
MREIRIHGRGGQGGVTAAQVLAVAASKDGKFSQAFPHFGVERRGAPVRAFARIDSKFIRVRQQVYEPDYLIILDSTLFAAEDVTAGLKPTGKIIVNSAEKVTVPNTKAKVYTVDATNIALAEIGKPIVNTPMLGAFAKVTGEVTLNSVIEALKEFFSGPILEKNIKAIQRSYNEVKEV